MTNYWNPEAPTADSENRPTTWRNYYATRFADSLASAAYALHHWDRLYADTLRFKEALFDTSFPDYVVDAVSANLSTLKSPTVLRLEDGSFYGFEGSHVHEGSCEGSCTHVWNYAYALPFLFPALERSMRDLDYRYNLRADGSMNFRLQLPLGRQSDPRHVCADGQFGGVIKAYRDWKLSGDDAWLRSNWDAIKSAIAFAWSPANKEQWDPKRTGVLWGMQHHTLDTELFGPNAYLTGYYLGALKAAAEIAEHFGELAEAEDYHRLFEKGSLWVDEHLFNGEYYQQDIDLGDRTVLVRFGQAHRKQGPIEEFYWDHEHGEIKHQIGGGCHSDQVIAQWHANICGLGPIFDRQQVRSALQAIYAHNFRPSMREFANPCRLYALDGESALVLCTWPDGVRRPAVPLTYADEAFTGVEYQVAAHMIQSGLVDEGLSIVKAIRERFDGEKRNPWNEFECGSNYARAMASFSLVPALSGFTFDMPKRYIGFAPVLPGAEFRCIWALDCSWGTYERCGANVSLHVESGTLVLQRFGDSLLAGASGVTADGFDSGSVTLVDGTLLFARPLSLAAGSTLRFRSIAEQ